MLRKNQLHWFDPPIPDSKKISSEDAIILAEPFAIQGAPGHAPNCISVVTLSDRYFLAGMTVAETEAWTRALQLVWVRRIHAEVLLPALLSPCALKWTASQHCLQPEMPGTIEVELLHTAVGQYQTQPDHSKNVVSSCHVLVLRSCAGAN